MTNEILTASGVPYRETQFLHDPPKKTYAVYMDDVEVGGSDYENLVQTHNITVELYEPKADPNAEAAIEAQLNANGLHYSKQARYWIPEAQRFQVIYEFTYITKT